MTRPVPPTRGSRRRSQRKGPTIRPPGVPARPSALPLTIDPADRPIVLATIVGAHGIAGEVRLKVHADDLGAYRLFNDGRLTLASLRNGSQGPIGRFVEIADRNAAEALRGTDLTVPRSALPPLADGDYYHVDLIGLTARDAAGIAIGTVVTVENFGAGDILEIERPEGKRFMVPVAATEIGETITVPDGYLEV